MLLLNLTGRDGMKYYDKLLKLKCFTMEDVYGFIPNVNTSQSIIHEYSKKGYVQNVKRNLYATLDLVTKEPVANKYEIASKISKDSYVSYHSAFEYYGFNNQVSYEMLVSSTKRFAPFYFNGIKYSFINSKIDVGIELNSKIRVTNLERTIVDNIDAFSKYMGLEELLRRLEIIKYVNEGKLLEILAVYDKQFLYQKVGYILSINKENLLLSDEFFDSCLSHIGKSKRYLYEELKLDEYSFNKQWKLILPKNIHLTTSKGIHANEII